MPRRAESQVTLASRSGSSEKAMQMEIQQVPWWNKRTRMERRGFVVVGTLVVISVSLAVGVVLLAKGPQDRFSQRQHSPGIVASKQTTAAFTADVPKFNNLPVNNKDYCFEKGCILAAADLLENINTAIDPCDNFYDFACGGFVEKTLIPDDRTRTSRFSVLGDTLNEQVRGLLELEIKGDDPKPFQMAKKVYQSCMDTETIEKIGLEPLKQVLRNMGGWPLLGDTQAIDGDFKWYEMMYKFREYGFSVDYLVDFSVTTDLKNSSWRVLDLDQPGLGMSREYLMKGVHDVDVQAYYEYMVDVAILMGADEQTARNEMMETLLFEIQIANITLKREDRRDASKLYNPMTVGNLSTLDGSTPWLEYINKLLTKDIIQVDASEIIIVDVPDYIINLSSLLTRTPARTQANYVM